MKKAVPYLITFAIALAAVAFWPKIKPLAQKIPVIGGWIA